MPISLHTATIPSMLQILGAAKGWLDKAEACTMSEGDVMKACLTDDMLPFAYQVKSMAVHSKGAFEGVKQGVFTPDMSEPPANFAGLRAKLGEAIENLAALSEDEVENLRGNGHALRDRREETFLHRR